MFLDWFGGGGRGGEMGLIHRWSHAACCEYMAFLYGCWDW